MKSINQFCLALASLGLASTAFAQTTTQPVVQPVTQSQMDGSARLVTECIISKAPANWDHIVVAVDRTNPQKAVLYNVASVSVKGKTQTIDINPAGCDVVKQVNDLGMFQAILPKDQFGWKVLALSMDSKNKYFVYTDLSMKK